MTTVDDEITPSSADGGDPGSDGADGASRPDEGRRWFTAEALLALELAGLAAFAFGRSTLDTFGRSPETFVARGADAPTVVAFGLVVAFVPALVLALVGLAGRPFGGSVRRWLHIVLVGAVGGVAVWQLSQSVTGLPPESRRLIALGVVCAPGIAALRARWPSTASFLRLAGGASVIFLLQFLFVSPTSGMVIGDGPKLDDDVVADVAADLGDDPPDVVMVVFDALPTKSLLDGTGHIDAEAFPNLGRLAATSDWYRNNTAVSAFTGQAVPAILTGRYRPTDAVSGRQEGDDHNLFTLLGGSYDVRAHEVVSRLCPVDMCPPQSSSGLGRLLGDAVGVWTGSRGDADDFDLPGALDGDRYADAADWIDGAELAPDRPDLLFYHLVLPHGPWYLSGDGQRYQPADDIPTGSYAMGWTPSGYPVGEQRHLLQLQAADRLLGQLLDELDAVGTFDESLVVVTADHGESFLPGEMMRGLTDGNMPSVLWTPLLVKAPGQTEPRIDDANVQAVDVVPTIADMLGVDVPWELDGVPATEAGERDDTKTVQENKHNAVHAPGDDVTFDIEGTHELFEQVLRYDPTAFDGPDAPWKRTPHGDLFGRAVDGLTIGADHEGEVDVDRLDDIVASDSSEPLAEVVGGTALPHGTVVAYALNGTIGAVTTVEPGVRGAPGLAHGLVPPGLFHDGDNELTAYVVEGPVGGEVLRPLTVQEGG